MPIIDSTYFVKDIVLPDQSARYSSDDLDLSIAMYEPEILKYLLGYELWKLVDAAIASPSGRYKDLIEGADFSFDYEGHTINTHWNGLKNTELISLISYYVYFKFRNNRESDTTTTGESVALKENAKIISPRSKIVYAWNRMIDLYGKVPRPRKLDLTYSNVELYFMDQGNYEHYNTEPSAFNFLLANLSTYPEWFFKPLYPINDIIY